MRFKALFVILACFLFCSCVTRQYYLSPFHATNQPYHAMPLVADSAKNSFYAGGSAMIGSANQSLKDQNFQVQGEVHRAHVFRNVQFNYGANLLIGSYTVRQLDNVTDQMGNRYPNAPLPGRRFYSGAGAFAGVNLVIPFKTGSEWRVIGFESNFQQEFGEYQSFRKNLPDSFARAIQRQSYFNTVGITTNVIKKFRRSGNTFGYKMGLYVATTGVQRTETIYRDKVIPVLLANTLHWSKDNVTAFIQLNLGDYAANFQAGASVRLGRNNK